MRRTRGLLPALSAVLLLCAAWRDARACACCTSVGERTDLVMKFESYYSDEIQRLRFSATAQLFLGEADPESVKGIATPSERYDLQAHWKNDRMLFSFRDQANHSGTLAIARPRTISIFHVDPRDDPPPPPSRGPVLYKEWRLSSPASGTGIFAPGLSQGQTLTLVLQGRGNNCTSAADFSHWMLVMWGPKTKYRFFGDLVTTR